MTVGAEDHHMTVGAEDGEIGQEGLARLCPIAQRLEIVDLRVVSSHCLLGLPDPGDWIQVER